MLAIANSEFFEVLLPDATQKYGLVEDLTVDREGMVRVPEGPGLGAQIDFELIRKKTIEVLR
jgi:L-alanine-DL-glutamate epimerase-like enolase superfamily enzyme